MKTRYRFCDSPAPAHGGRDCGRKRTEKSSCNTDNCPGSVPRNKIDSFDHSQSESSTRTERQTKTPRNFAPYLHHSVTWGGRDQSRFTCSLAYFNSHNQQCPAKSSFDNNLVKCRYLLTEQLIRTSYMESFLNI